jgi:hypothetical protein
MNDDIKEDWLDFLMNGSWVNNMDQLIVGLVETHAHQVRCGSGKRTILSMIFQYE